MVGGFGVRRRAGISIPRRSVAVLGATAAVAAAAAVLVSAAPAAAQARAGAFSGNWVGIEIPGDGSTDVMTIGRNSRGKLIWHYRETNASGFCSGGSLKAYGTGSVHGHTLTVTVTIAKCANGSPGASPTPFNTTMTATGDGHINWGGILFSRAGTGKVTPFTASFQDGGLQATCSGARIVSSQKVQDIEKCLETGDTSSLVAGTFQGHPRGTLPWVAGPIRWSSDYNGAIARLWRVTSVNNGDGTWTVSILAYY